MTTIPVYRKGLTTGPPRDLLWLDGTGATIDLSTGYTFTAKIVLAKDETVLKGTKTTGITGSSGSTGYNVRIDWETADFTSLDPGTYLVILVATPSGGDPFEFPSLIAFELKAGPA